MSELSSNDNDYMERILLGTSTSLSTTPSLESYSRRNSIASMPGSCLSTLIKTNRHRLLPQIPAYYLRRSSSPRILPTPPTLLSSTSTTVTSDLTLHNWNLERRPITGRRLPQIPQTAIVKTNSNRLITDKKNVSIRQQYSTTVNGDNVRNIGGTNNITGITGNINDNEWPSPTIVERKFSESQELHQSDNNHSSFRNSLRSLQRLPFLKQQLNRYYQPQPQQQQQNLQQERGKLNQSQYSLDHSNCASTSTNAHSQSSSLSPSVDQY
ncbi:unnamed protein product [Onchocerca ochengi]|uniref:Uncharacterized protein n=1 Tax=Onchocerca ochengi TaxID=42157 RepID=A0A182EQ87_ONCOC|nr:unnamed protein product [Onchocerca ochengi]